MNQLKDIQKHLFDLENIIDEKQQQLEAYACKPNASKAYITKGNSQIQLLIKIHNYINSVNVGIGNELNSVIDNARQKDPNAGNVMILVRLGRGNEHIIYQEIQL